MKRKPVKKWKRILKRIILLMVVLALLGGGVWYAYGSLKSEYTVTYDTYTATTGSISNSLSFSGTFALVDSKSYSPSSATTVKTLYVAAGDDVKEGDKLVRLANGEIITADFDGRVNLVGVEEGDDVDANTTLVQIADFSHMMISIRVDEYDIADVSVGQAVTVTATATEETFDSTIKTINYISQSQGNVAYYTATADVDVSDGIYPGMQATVTITQEEANDVVILKEDALSFDAMNNAYVYMMGDDGTMTEVPVTVGVSNGNYVEIKEGLSDGDTVYVQAQEEETSSGLSGLLSGLFGSQNVNGGGMPSSGSSDFSGFSGGQMPSDFTGGDTSGSSSGGMSGGPGGGSGGGGQ